MEKDSKQSRLTQYLDFVKLYTEVHREVSAKKDANIIWKEKIQKETNDQLSMSDYLEQLAILRTKKNIQLIKDRRTCGHHEVDMFLDLEIPIEFSCEGASKSVEIAGTFNNWQPEPLKYNTEDGDWLTTLNLAPGVHYYKYVVDGEWMHNPNKECEEDEKGNINNVMRIEDKFTRKLREIKEEREELQEFLEEPWAVNSHKYNYCIKI